MRGSVPIEDPTRVKAIYSISDLDEFRNKSSSNIFRCTESGSNGRIKQSLDGKCSSEDSGNVDMSTSFEEFEEYKKQLEEKANSFYNSNNGVIYGVLNKRTGATCSGINDAKYSEVNKPLNMVYGSTTFENKESVYERVLPQYAGSPSQFCIENTPTASSLLSLSHTPYHSTNLEHSSHYKGLPPGTETPFSRKLIPGIATQCADNYVRQSSESSDLYATGCYPQRRPQCLATCQQYTSKYQCPDTNSLGSYSSYRAAVSRKRQSPNRQLKKNHRKSNESLSSVCLCAVPSTKKSSVLNSCANKNSCAPKQENSGRCCCSSKRHRLCRQLVDEETQCHLSLERRNAPETKLKARGQSVKKGHKCRDCMTRVPFGTLIATVMCCVGVGVFCGTMYRGTTLTLRMFDEVFRFHIQWVEPVQLTFMIIGGAMGGLGLMILFVGFLSTGETRSRVYKTWRGRVGGRISCAIFMSITYILAIAWLIMLCFLVVVTMMYTVAYLQCEYIPQNECIDYNQISFLFPPGTPEEDMRVCIGEKKIFCKDYVSNCEIMFILSTIASFLIIVSLVHFLMCLAANYAHIKDQEKFVDLQEIQYLQESEMSTLPKDRF